MKKLLEVVVNDDHSVRFDTDFDAGKDPGFMTEVIPLLALAMTTTLWGGNERSVLAAIRALAIADLGVSVNRSEMILGLDQASARLEEAMRAAREEMRQAGMEIQSFAPGVGPRGPHS